MSECGERPGGTAEQQGCQARILAVLNIIRPVKRRWTFDCREKPSFRARSPGFRSVLLLHHEAMLGHLVALWMCRQKTDTADADMRIDVIGSNNGRCCRGALRSRGTWVSEGQRVAQEWVEEEPKISMPSRQQSAPNSDQESVDCGGVRFAPPSESRATGRRDLWLVCLHLLNCKRSRIIIFDAKMGH